MSGHTSDDSQNEMDHTVPSQEQHSEESSLKSIDDSDQDLLQLSKIANGDPQNIRNKLNQQFLSEVAEKNNYNIEEEKSLRLSKKMNDLINSPMTTLGMICQGRECPFYKSCPIANEGLQVPVGEDCPVERVAFNGWVTKHLSSLGIEDPTDPVYSFDMDTLFEIASQEIIRWRCSAHLSDTPDLVKREQVGSTVQNEAIEADVVTPLLEVLFNANRNIANLKKSLVATREAQIKAGKDTQDSSQKAADLKARMEELVKKRLAGREASKNLHKQQEEIKDADYTIRGGDEDPI